MNISNKTSILGLNWQQKLFDERLATSIRQRFDLSEVLSNLLSQREITIDEIENFLEPKIKVSLPDPFELSDMEKAVSHTIDAIWKNKKITLFADYDVDGATSAATLKRFFRDIGIAVDIYIPDRILEGYGPNSAALLNLKKNGTDLVIMLDCGTVAFKPLEDAAQAGLDIIVIDHHLGVLEKPKSIAVINPNLIDEKFAEKNICAAGVTFLFVVALNKKLRQLGFYHPPLEGGSNRNAVRGGVLATKLEIAENSRLGYFLPLEGGSNCKAVRGGAENSKNAQRFYSSETLKNAKELRDNQTDAEGLLWFYLRNKQLDGHKFKRQQPFENYIADFVCFEKKLIIELDGSQHNKDEQIKYDATRTEFMQQLGYKVLRFWNYEIFKNINDVLETIFNHLNFNPAPNHQRAGSSTRPQGGENSLNGYFRQSQAQWLRPLPEPRCSSTLPQGAGDLFYSLQADSEPQGEGNKNRVKEPNLLNLLDLTALGTVCDVMPLTDLNRAFVSAGLKILKQRKNLGLREICDLAGLDEEPSAYHLGFIIGPRINAGGRVGKSDLGATILASEDEEEVKEIALQLENFNKQRKDIEAQVLDEAVKSLELGSQGFSKNDSIIFAVSKNWHQGVIGIVASRLKDLYGKPTAVIAIDDEGKKGKASCRSISGIDFGAEILNARLSGLLLEGGGHAMAAGFSVEIDKISDLHKFLCQKLDKKIAEITAQNLAHYDIALDLPQVNLELLKELSKLEPFGVGNARPKFLLRDVVKIKANLIGKTQEHISCLFSAKTTLGFQNQIQAVAFRSANTKLAEVLLDNKFNKPISLVGTLNINVWGGIEKVQLIIEDILI